MTPNGPDDRPTCVLLMPPETVRAVFDDAALTTLTECTELLRDEAGRPLVVADLDTAPWDRLAGAEIVVTGWGSPFIDEAVAARLPHLRAIVHTPGSIRPIVAPEVLQSGVQVSSAAATNAIPVAEFTVAAIVFAAKRTSRHIAAYRATGQLRSQEDRELWHGTHGITVGVVGASRIGRLVLEQLRDKDFQLLIADPYLDKTAAETLGAKLVDLPKLLRQSDIVTLHAPELPSTRHLLDAAGLALMPDGAVLINTARGSLVDTEALLSHLTTGRLDAYLDVADPEPLPADSPLFRLPNVVVTPHIAGAMGNEVRRLGDAAVEEVRRLASGEPLQHQITVQDLDRIA
ncbi:hydroxyacid dehydrogenase [Flexivirga meconopsidis]|uniref:hydroxyacid dehydrogenase n=1 Tax=Flexivirga meconopsidis TaxID=2977121 RepID=UPI00223F442D|nr:hydroxyacid dehydrogenase [Flexivirga meconopsidis]